MEVCLVLTLASKCYSLFAHFHHDLLQMDLLLRSINSDVNKAH